MILVDHIPNKTLLCTSIKSKNLYELHLGDNDLEFSNLRHVMGNLYA